MALLACLLLYSFGRSGESTILPRIEGDQPKPQTLNQTLMQVAGLIQQYDTSESGTLDRYEFEHMVLILPTDALSDQLIPYLAN